MTKEEYPVKVKCTCGLKNTPALEHNLACPLRMAFLLDLYDIHHENHEISFAEFIKGYGGGIRNVR